jgi:hypothetical protein
MHARAIEQPTPSTLLLDCHVLAQRGPYGASDERRQLVDAHVEDGVWQRAFAAFWQCGLAPSASVAAQTHAQCGPNSPQTPSTPPTVARGQQMHAQYVGAVQRGAPTDADWRPSRACGAGKSDSFRQRARAQVQPYVSAQRPPAVSPVARVPTVEEVYAALPLLTRMPTAHTELPMNHALDLCHLDKRAYALSFRLDVSPRTQYSTHTASDEPGHLGSSPYQQKLEAELSRLDDAERGKHTVTWELDADRTQCDAAKRLKRTAAPTTKESTAAKKARVAAKKERVAAKKERVAAKKERVAAEKESTAAKKARVAAKKESTAAKKESTAAKKANPAEQRTKASYTITNLGLCRDAVACRWSRPTAVE